MSEIYKYTSVESAISILKNESVRLTNPKNFNDPYDCNFDQDVKDNKKIDKLLKNYCVVKALDKLVSDEKIKVKDVASKIVLSIIRMEMEIMRVLLRKRPFFSKILGFNFLLNILCKFNGNIKQLIDEELKKKDDFIQKGLIEIKSSIGISCFSKKNNSILMWSHYADSHKGVCLAYENTSSKIFNDVVYSKKRHSIKLYELARHALAKDFINEKIDELKDKIILKDLTTPFLIKSKEWEYEKEVRCIYSNKNQSNDVYCDGEHYYFKIGLPTKIYIGSKATDYEIDKLLKMAYVRDIPVYFMKESKEDFSIVVDNDRKYNPQIVEREKENTLNRIINDIEKCIKQNAYIAAFATALIIPAICSQVEIGGNYSAKERYINWCNTYFECSQKPSGYDGVYLSGEVCWDIKEQLFAYGNIDVTNKYEEQNLEKVVLMFDKPNSFNIYIDQSSKTVIKQNVNKFCSGMISQAKRCYDEHKDKINNMSQIPIYNLVQELDDFEELKALNNRINKTLNK